MEQVGSPLWATLPELEDELAAWPGSTDETLRVLEEEGKAVAFGGIKPEGHATIVGPLVAPSSRGREIGSTLIGESVELARARLLVGRGLRWCAKPAAQLLLEGPGFGCAGVDAVYRLHPEDYRPTGSCLRA